MNDETDFRPPAFAVFDTETTGTDVENDRIVSAYLGYRDEDRGLFFEKSWLIDPGVPIPDGATAVHGITDDHVRAHGDIPMNAILDIVGALDETAEAGMPVVIYNAPFDLTLLDNEYRRHLDPDDAESCRSRLAGMLVLDPLVIDKAVDRYRRGSRKLADVAAHYGIDTEGVEFHGARADAIIAGQVMRYLWMHTKIFGFPADHLFERQTAHAIQQQEQYRDYRRGIGDDVSGFRIGWPFFDRVDQPPIK